MSFDFKNIDQSARFIEEQFFLPFYTNLHEASEKNSSFVLKAPLIGLIDGTATFVQGVASVAEAVLKGGSNLLSGTLTLDKKSALLGSVQILLGGGVIGFCTLPLSAWKTLKITLGLLVNSQETTNNQKIYYQKKLEKESEVLSSSQIEEPKTDNEAFFNKPDYESQLEKECALDKALPKASYSYETESKIVRIAKAILSFIFLPFTFFHWLGGKLVIPASWYNRSYATALRTETSFSAIASNWKYKRTTVDINGTPIDAMIITRESTSNNGTWILGSNGNGGLYESVKYQGDNDTLKALSLRLDANILVFNYPGVAASGGSPSHKGISDAYKGMLHFLEDKEKGLGAKTIIARGLSLGGGAQAEGFDSHDLKSDINYLLIKDRTFSTLSKAASGIFWPLGLFPSLLGWNINTLSGSKKVKAPEIIMQTADIFTAQEITDSKDLAQTDQIITKTASLAYGILEDEEKDSLLKNKIILGIPEMHNDRLSKTTLDTLVNKIKQVLDRQKLGVKLAA